MSSTAEHLPSRAYESKQGTVIGLVALFIVVAIAAVVLRFKSRSMVKASLGIDDWIILLALPIAVAEAICVAYATKDGLGRHVEVLSEPTLLEGGKIFFTIQILWIISSGLVKLSILAFYLRIFSILNYIRFSAWSLIVIVSVWMASVTISHGLECTPVAKVWDDALPGHCLNTVALFMVGSIADVVADFLILLLPLPAIVKLQMPLSKKISLIAVFTMGGLYVHHIVSSFGVVIMGLDADVSAMTRTCALSLIRFLGARTVMYDRLDITCEHSLTPEAELRCL